MNPGLAVTLRPVTPWRIGPDSGVRNRVDSVYHSDTLYSAVTSAMARFGRLDEWLGSTARAQQPAVCFSSCFPLIDGVRYVAPPRHLWPPASPSLLSARVRWKSAKFVPVAVVRDVLAGKPLKENHWTVDGVSGCLMPEGSAAPFRTVVRWSAAVDRLTGAADRHSIACAEFRMGAGMWTLVSFANESARSYWMEPVRAVFRWLCDSGFGGERSRGWGRAEDPVFREGQLPEMILGTPGTMKEPAEPEPLREAHQKANVVVLPVKVEPSGEQAPLTVAAAAPSSVASDAAPGAAPALPASDVPSRTETESTEPEPATGEAASTELPAEPAPDTGTAGEPTTEPQDRSAAAAAVAVPAPPDPALPPAEEPRPDLPPTVLPSGLTAHWLLSLYTPSETDAVDWSRGNYALVERGGRIDSPAGAGELKKQLRMIEEGSVVYASTAPCGAAPDVAPDGFAHPVFRSGFALSIPLGGGTQ